jgi:hypothetical protein
MAVAAHHIAFGAAAASLIAVGIRLASLAAADGLDRLLAAAALVAATAVLEALGLGLVGWGGNPVALTAAALATWVLARALVPAPAVSVPAEAARAWRSSGPIARAAVLAAAGLAAGWTAWLVAYPFLGVDALAYHLTEIVTWVRSGHPGQVVTVTLEFPVGYYPVTNEVLLAWGTGIARSFAPAALAGPAALALAATAGWAALRALRVPTEAAVLAIVAVVSGPIVVLALAGPNTELPALAWLAVTAALCVGAARRPALLAPAIVAAGLAVGTKTTTALLVAVVLAVALIRERAHLRALWRPLALAIAAAAVVGGTWYVRNLLVHGWPLWPFQATSFSDQLPAAMRRLDFSFLDRPRATLRGREDEYAGMIAGYLVLLAGIVAAPVLARRRSVLAAAAVAALAVLAWMAAPFTGIADNPLVDLSISTVRYLLPAVAAAAAALALAARAGATARGVCDLAFAGAVVWNVIRDVELGRPFAPLASWLLVGAAAGALAAFAVGRLARGGAPRLPGGVRAGVVTALAAVGLVAVANGYLERHSRVRTFDAGVAHYLTDQPAYRRGSAPVDAGLLTLGILAGDRLRHPVRLIPAREPCARIRQRARHGWVTVRRNPFPQLVAPTTLAACLAGDRPVYADPFFTVYHFPTGAP